MTRARNIVVAGSLAQRPGVGGHTWVLLQYLLGFKKLGYDVLFLDRLEPEMCTDRAGAACAFEQSYNLQYFLNVMGRFDVEHALFFDAGRKVVGRGRSEVLRFVQNSELMLNVMGFFEDGEVRSRAKRKVFLDIDPGFGQMWRELKLHDLFVGHDDYVTIGQNIGREDCEIPTCGIDWITTPQPVVLDYWPMQAPPAANSPITSIVSWRGPFGPVEYNGKVYGLRAHEFRKFTSLPRLVDAPFELALDIHPADAKDLATLADNGWTLVEPKAVAADPESYQAYIQRSFAELMIAKNMYVQTRSGWFSDRSVCYLASGRPVLAQDTGLADLLPTGQGLITFKTLEEATEGVRRITSDYSSHFRAARALAEEHFDSDKVLCKLMSKLGVAA